ncbi:MAG: TonB family protein [Flavobacteriales bacterium]|nr:TonB family protein [Flavobacteriales bacterium]
MRDELHLLELADRYLDGTMEADERSAFEVRMAGSQELRDVVNDQRALREGMHRVNLRMSAAKAYTTYRFGNWWPWVAGSAVIVGLGITGTLLLSHEDAHTVQVANVLDPIAGPQDTIVEARAPDSASTERTTHYRAEVDTLFDTVYVATMNGKRVSWDSIPKGAVIVEQRPIASQEAMITTADGGNLRALTKDEIALRLDSVTLLGQPADLPESPSTTEPMFKGGWDAMHRYLQVNIRPVAKSDASGTVIVDFLVDELGRISDVQLKQSLSEAHDKEAVRVIKGMPKWLPCKTNGKPARCRMTVPLMFGERLRDK